MSRCAICGNKGSCDEFCDQSFSEMRDSILELRDSLEKLQAENSELKRKLDLAVEALKKYKKATNDLEPVVSHQLQIVSDFEDFADSVGAGYVSKEQKEWNKMVYEAAEIIELRCAEKALAQIRGEG